MKAYIILIKNETERSYDRESIIPMLHLRHVLIEIAKIKNMDIHLVGEKIYDNSVKFLSS
jgi:hypothetical protein